MDFQQLKQAILGTAATWGIDQAWKIGKAYQSALQSLPAQRKQLALYNPRKAKARSKRSIRIKRTSQMRRLFSRSRKYRRTYRKKSTRSSLGKRRRAYGKRSSRRTSSRRSTIGKVKRFVENVVNNMHSSHVYTRLSTVTASSSINSKAFLVLPPANDVTTCENYIATLVGTDGFQEKSSKAVVRNLTKTYEFHANGNPGYMRIYWLVPRNNPDTATSGAISSGASSIASLITADNTTYVPGISLATNLETTLFDCPSIVRDYKIIKVTKWRKLSPVNNQAFTVKQKARYPKIFDAGSDKLSTKWLYLPGSVIPVVEMKGYMGMDGNYVINPAERVPATNNTLTQYDIQETVSNLGSFGADPNGVTHLNVSPFSLMVRIMSRCDLTLLSDETREVNSVLDTTPNGGRPYLIAPRVEAYLSSAT